MKSVIIMAFVGVASLLSVEASSQEAFEMDYRKTDKGAIQAGIKSGSFAVIKLGDESMAKLDVYNQAISWVNRTYVNPAQVIKAAEPGEYIRLSVATKVGTNQVKYQIEMRFKSGRIKMSVSNFYYYMPPSEYSSGGWVSRPNGLYWKYKKKNGRRAMYAAYPEAFLSQLNELVKSLKMQETVEESQDSDW